MGKQSCGDMAADAGGAGHDGGFRWIEFVEAVAEVIDGDVDGVFSGSQRGLGDLAGCADIDQLIRGQVGVAVSEGVETIEGVAGGEGGHMEHVLGRTEGWRVGKVEVGEVADGSLHRHEGGDDIESFVDALSADGLGAKDTAG